MPITGYTGTAQLDDQVDTKQVSQRVVETAYARAIVDAFCGALGGHDFINGSKVRAYSRLNKLNAGPLVEGEDGVPIALGDTSRTITISEHGVGVDYGDMLEVANSTPQGRARVQRLMARAYADRIEQQLLALATSFTQQVGVTNTPWSEDKFLACINRLEAAEADGPFFAIFHTTQVGNLRTAAAGVAANQGAVYTREGVLGRIGPAMASGYVTTQFECDVFKSSNCPVAGQNNVDKVGMVLPMSIEFFPLLRLIGQFPDGSVWDGRYEEQRDASARLTEMWMTGVWGTGLLALDYGVGAVSVG